MHASAKLHHSTVNLDGPTPSHLVVSVTGDEGDRLRPTLGLVFVIDQSGSMAWQNKHSTVTSSLRYLSTYLSDNDEVALVSFASSVKIELDTTRATKDGLARFESALCKLHAQGGTDLDKGLKVGIALANKIARDDVNRVVRVIVLTDGDATSGECNPSMIERRMDSASSSVSLSTIGVGSDCNHNLLGRLAERGSGSYGFVESPGQAAEVLGTEIGGLINLDASDVKVVVEARATYLSVSPALGVTCTTDSDGRIVVQLGNLVAGQTRNVVFPVTTCPPKHSFARPVTSADVTISGRVEDAATTIACKPKVHFATGLSIRDESLDETVDLAVLAVAQKAAEARAAHNDFAGASSILRSFADTTFTAGVAVLGTGLEVSYQSAANYQADQGLRNSAGALLGAATDLVGSSQAFNSLVNRTVGDYSNDAARQVGLETARNVASASGHTGAGVGHDPSADGFAGSREEGFAGSREVGCTGADGASTPANTGTGTQSISVGSAEGAWFEKTNLGVLTGTSTSSQAGVGTSSPAQNDVLIAAPQQDQRVGAGSTQVMVDPYGAKPTATPAKKVAKSAKRVPAKKSKKG
jgi:hypothetical protein